MMILLSSYSEGSASEHQANRLGEYKLTGVLADRPIYKNEQGDEFLFYLRVRSWLFLMPMYIKQHNEANNDEFENKNHSQSKNKGLWMIGPEAGQFNGGLAHRFAPRWLSLLKDNNNKE